MWATAAAVTRATSAFVRLRLARPRLNLGLELGDPGGRGRGCATALGAARRRGVAQPRVQLVDLLGERVALGDDGAQSRLELLDARRAVDRLRSGDLGKRGLGPDRAEARADPELGLEQAAVLLGERVCDRTLGDEAEVDEHLSERVSASILLGERDRQLVEGQEPLVDHELA